MSWFDQRPDDAMMGSFEAVGAEHIATIDSAQFREAMSQLGAAVHVVTTAGPAGGAGVFPPPRWVGGGPPPHLLPCGQPGRPGPANPPNQPPPRRPNACRRVPRDCQGGARARAA